MRLEKLLGELASQVIADALALPEPPDAVLRPTQDPKFGDYQVNAAMQLAKVLGKKPREIAEPIAAALAAHEAIERAEVAGPGFVNISLRPTWLAARLTEALRDTERDGVEAVAAPKTIVVDYSSPNIAKQMHVGHVRSTIIGDSIVRMLRFVGHRVIGDNHLGDWGTQFGLLIVGMRRWGSPEALDAEPMVELERVYKLASEEATKDEAFAQSARDELAKLQAGDEENLALWRRFVDTTRASLEAIYDRLDVHFDVWLGESFYDDRLAGVVDLLLERGIARESDGAICVFFGDHPSAPKALQERKEPFIIRKKDGAFLYSTSDIATVQYRREHFGADKAIYVVDSRQSHHFKQLFAAMELLGETMQLEHVGFGTILGDDGKPKKTRDVRGNVETLASLLDEAERRAAERIAERDDIRVAEEDLPEVARVVGIGAVKYADLQQNRLSDYRFDWDKMIAFSGDAAPYLQYAYARTQSIFREGDTDAHAVARDATVVLAEPAEVALGKALARFGDVIYRAAETSQPHLVCEHLYALARSYSAFYRDCKVLQSEGEVRASRLALNGLFGRQLARGLGLLGIGVVPRM